MKKETEKEKREMEKNLSLVESTLVEVVEKVAGEDIAVGLGYVEDER